MNKSVLLTALYFVAISFPLSAQAESVYQLSQRSEEAARVIEQVMSIPERAIPRSLLSKAVCVATVPNTWRVGFVFGARYGKGLVACRRGESWSQPSFIQLKGGSWGYQFGIQSVDLVIVFVRANAIEKFSRNNLTFGLDATVVAGPVGRDAQLGTDYQLNSEIYSYSRANGLFLGLAIQGTSLSVDKVDNLKIHGQVSAEYLLTSDNRRTPSIVTAYTDSLIKFAPAKY